MIYSGMLLGGLWNDVQARELNVIEKCDKQHYTHRLGSGRVRICTGSLYIHLFMMIIMRGYLLPLL